MSRRNTFAHLFTRDLPPDRKEWRDRVRALAPLLQENRDAAESDRATPEETFRALAESGLTRLWVSTAFGGSAASIPAGSTAIRELARIDASIAWQIGVQGAIGRLSDYLPVPTARKLFLDSDGFVVGAVNPAGRAEKADGGYILSGTWGFASGSAHADWIVCAAFVTEDGDRRTVGGAPEVRMLFIPKEQAHFSDTWHTLGLRGTGSNDFSVDGVFVPDDFTVAGADLNRPPAPTRAYPIGYYDFGPFTSASTALGIGRDALDTLRSVVAGKIPAAGSRGLADSPVLQERLARLEMRLHAAGVVLDDAARCAEESGETGGDRLSALIRLSAVNAAEAAVETVNQAYVLAGTGSLYTSSRLERCLRDVHSATKHITLSPTHYETVGGFLLGGDLVMRR
ncbi:acyl-CoA dehydrogenase family protein [Nocardiopsis suaedae]|uniref:Acyl-CoA dehydrogenase family protein n=1 Tax=Nocardiopsis suaedae TaxID=3018444 RepID=A0ABT4TSG5_9ACTN|nr:acyl-CoA dehydrogenase family protein [Nocardiopsis suaedae]MDA2807641.1 acyl-CoA dehydrogenase family protein [Nocardiopsis suaedae]